MNESESETGNTYDAMDFVDSQGTRNEEHTDAFRFPQCACACAAESPLPVLSCTDAAGAVIQRLVIWRHLIHSASSSAHLAIVITRHEGGSCPP